MNSRSRDDDEVDSSLAALTAAAASLDRAAASRLQRGVRFDAPEPVDETAWECVLCPVIVAGRDVQNAPHEVAPLMPQSVTDAAVVLYRSVGCGLWGVALRCIGMPLEKVALYANSARVAGKDQLTQAVRLTFENGRLAPYRVIGPASLVAWFLQYSSMSFVFQLADSVLSLGCGVPRVVYGDEVHQTPSSSTEPSSAASHAAPQPAATARAMLKLSKDIAAASVAGLVESAVSNRAEVQRHHGISTFAAIERRLGWRGLQRACGPAFAANVSRNTVMAYSAFVATPQLYATWVPQEHKSSGSFFAFGLAVNMFLGNAVAVTQQALWGRAVDACARPGGGVVSYRAIVSDALRTEGAAAFITPAKWTSRVLMNAPAEGTLAWFYNRVLPAGEPAFLRGANALYAALLRARRAAAAPSRQ